MKRNATTGVVTQIASAGTAGDTQPGYSGDGGPATAAHLNYPYGIALDAAGNLYIADWNNDAIRKIDTSGIITTVVGNGGAGDEEMEAEALRRLPLWMAHRGLTMDPRRKYVYRRHEQWCHSQGGADDRSSLPPTRMSPITVSQQKVMLQFDQALTISGVATRMLWAARLMCTVGTLQGCTADGTEKRQQAAGTTCTVPIACPKYSGPRPACCCRLNSGAGNLSFPLTGTALASQIAITPGA